MEQKYSNVISHLKKILEEKKKIIFSLKNEIPVSDFETQNMKEYNEIKSDPIASQTILEIPITRKTLQERENQILMLQKQLTNGVKQISKMNIFTEEILNHEKQKKYLNDLMNVLKSRKLRIKTLMEKFKQFQNQKTTSTNKDSLIQKLISDRELFYIQNLEDPRY